MKKLINMFFLCAFCLTLVACTHSLPTAPNKIDLVKTADPPPPPDDDDEIEKWQVNGASSSMV